MGVFGVFRLRMQLNDALIESYAALLGDYVLNHPVAEEEGEHTC